MSGSSPPVSSRIRLPSRCHSFGSSPPGGPGTPFPRPLPLLRVLGGLVAPEPVALGGAVDDALRAHRPADLGLLLAGDDAPGVRAAVEGELRGVGPQPAARAPDE